MKRGAVVRGRAGIYVGYLLLFFWLVTEGDGRIHLVKLYPFVRVGAILALLEKAVAIRARKTTSTIFFRPVGALFMYAAFHSRGGGVATAATTVVPTCSEDGCLRGDVQLCAGVHAWWCHTATPCEKLVCGCHAYVRALPWSAAETRCLFCDGVADQVRRWVKRRVYCVFTAVVVLGIGLVAATFVRHLR